MQQLLLYFLFNLHFKWQFVFGKNIVFLIWLLWFISLFETSQNRLLQSMVLNVFCGNTCYIYHHYIRLCVLCMIAIELLLKLSGQHYLGLFGNNADLAKLSQILIFITNISFWNPCYRQLDFFLSPVYIGAPITDSCQHKY